MHAAYANKGRGPRCNDDAAVIETMKMNVPQCMTDCFSMIKAYMFAGQACCGAKPGVS